jgi:hypothetical protein
LEGMKEAAHRRVMKSVSPLVTSTSMYEGCWHSFPPVYFDAIFVKD